MLSGAVNLHVEIAEIILCQPILTLQPPAATTTATSFTSTAIVKGRNLKKSVKIKMISNKLELLQKIKNFELMREFAFLHTWGAKQDV